MPPRFPNLEKAMLLIVDPIFSAMIPVIDNEPLTSAMLNIDAHFLFMRQTKEPESKMAQQ